MPEVRKQHVGEGGGEGDAATQGLHELRTHGAEKPKRNPRADEDRQARARGLIDEGRVEYIDLRKAMYATLIEAGVPREQARRIFKKVTRGFLVRMLTLIVARRKAMIWGIMDCKVYFTKRPIITIRVKLFDNSKRRGTNAFKWEDIADR